MHSLVPCERRWVCVGAADGTQHKPSLQFHSEDYVYSVVANIHRLLPAGDYRLQHDYNYATFRGVEAAVMLLCRDLAVSHTEGSMKRIVGLNPIQLLTRGGQC